MFDKIKKYIVKIKNVKSNIVFSQNLKAKRKYWHNKL